MILIINPTQKSNEDIAHFLIKCVVKGFIFNLIKTFLNFKRRLLKLIINKNNHQMKDILKLSIVILITAETIDILFYKSSLFLAIPLSLIIGTLTLTIVESLKKMKMLLY
jgi:hypothetical protein